VDLCAAEVAVSPWRVWSPHAIHSGMSPSLLRLLGVVRHPKTSASSSSGRAAASPSASPASASQLARIVLQPKDFPRGWKHTPSKLDPRIPADNAAVTSEFLKCLGLPNQVPDQVAEAHSDDFARGDAHISSVARSFRSQNTVDAGTAALQSSKATRCFEQQFASFPLPAGSTFDLVSVKVTPGSAGGPANVVATGVATARITVGGTAVEVYLSHAYIVGPLLAAGVDSFSAGAPVPESLMDSLIAAVANRAARP
jgi:hypothetical protein